MNRNKDKKRPAELPSNKPFFARFLEKQALEKVVGGELVTMKFPSDSDEGEV